MGVSWLSTMDNEGRTPLDRAFGSGHRAIAEMMLKQEKEDGVAEDDITHPMHRAALLGLTGAVQTLITVGSDPTEYDAQQETPLHKAAREGHLDTVRELAAVTNVNAISGNGMTALHWACISGNLEVAEALVEHGADHTICCEGTDGLNAREVAAMMGYDEVVAVLDGRVAVYI